MLDLPKLAKDIFREYDCGNIVAASDAFILTLDIEEVAEAYAALEDLRKCSPHMDVSPRFVGDDLVEYKYIIIKSRDTITLYRQELSIVMAALMAAESFSCHTESHQNFI